MALTKATLIDLNSNELVLDLDADTSITANTDDQIDFRIGGNDILTVTPGVIDLKNDGGTVSKMLFYCESNNAHAQTLIGAPHSEGATNTLTLPGTGGNARLVSTTSTATLTNKTLTSPDINTSIELLARAEARFQDASGGQFVGLEAPATVSSSFVLTLPAADGSSGQFLKTDGSGALSFDTVSSAADDLTTGDAAVTIATSSGNITIDAQAGDADIIFKGTDSSSDITPMTLDMSDAGALLLTGGKIDLKNSGTRSKILFYCESSNAHAQTLQAAPHSEAASNTLTLPSTGGNVDLVSTASTATLTNKTLTTPRIVDNGYVQFGTDNEVRLISNPDKGVILKHTATADDKPIILTLQTGETDMAANDVMGKIEFQAPDEGTGTDAILVAAAIQAVSEGDFSSSNNATRLEFHTGASEAASSKMTLSSAGLLTIADDLVIKDGGTIGVDSDADAITIASNGAVTFSQTPVFPDGSLALADLDIDGGTDIGADLADADLFIVDDGAGGTNRKLAASRIKTYAGFTASTITGTTALATQPAADDEMIISDAGTLKRLDIKHIQNTPAFAANLSATQSIPHDNATKVAFATEIFDSDSVYDAGTNYRFTPGVAGKYFLYARIGFSEHNTSSGNVVDQGEISCRIYKNGSSISHSGNHSSVSGVQGAISVNSHVIADLDADDYVEVYASVGNNGGNAANLLSNAAYNEFGGFRIAGI